MSERETIHLAADISFLHTDFLWRMPGSWVGYPYYSSSEFYEDLAKVAEHGKFDLLFFGDTGGTSEDFGGNHNAVVSHGVKWPRHDMTPMVPILARLTKNIGYALTMSTTYHHPFHCARTFNSLDHVTKGRIAWNAVTSAYRWEAMNWGFEVMMDHDERYRRAQEFLQVACALWDSVEPDAVILDRESGEFLNPEKVHRLDFKGDYFNVRGPLPALPSPQQRPVIIQAGSSGPGMDLAAKYADLQFSTRRTVESMKQHRAAIDEKLVNLGRTPRDLGILWSVRVQVAESQSEARAKEQAFLDSIPPEGGLIEMSQWFGVDFSTAELNMTLSDFADQVREQKGNLGTFDELLKTTDPKMTVREFGRDYMTQRVMVAEGTPEEIVDKLEMIHYETGANGGFILARGFHASDNMREFVDHVVPELQRRGLSKTKYSGPTLRENFND
ncbi:MAG: methylene-tetrahydromethanopterin reductase [Rhodospirillaceae bacterium]|nr:methylene-tetrahydromethanopterin reductase [Rhodospirillaceae bacterium]|tara:strand:+ start:2861 stop:4189 length:1329 start_codon:yes stop_codon:yes gene_type:complete